MKEKNIELISITLLKRVTIKVEYLLKEKKQNKQNQSLDATANRLTHRRGVMVAHQSSKLG